MKTGEIIKLNYGTVFVSTELFQQFWVYRDEFDVLCQARVFEIKNGQVIIHKDNNGKIQRIDTKITPYRRKKKDVDID